MRAIEISILVKAIVPHFNRFHQSLQLGLTVATEIINIRAADVYWEFVM